MKYCVFTSKYHDGFAMFDTSYDDYVFYNWPEYSMGKRNFRAGMRPPLCGYVANPYKDSNGSWIRTKLWYVWHGDIRKQPVNFLTEYRKR